MTDAKVDIDKRYKTPQAILRACLRLFEESPSNWTRHMRRRPRTTANGGTAFCATGGIEHFAANPKAAHAARDLLCDQLGRSVEVVNDTQGRKAILDGLKAAAK